LPVLPQFCQKLVTNGKNSNLGESEFSLDSPLATCMYSNIIEKLDDQMMHATNTRKTWIQTQPGLLSNMLFKSL